MSFTTYSDPPPDHQNDVIQRGTATRPLIVFRGREIVKLICPRCGKAQSPWWETVLDFRNHCRTSCQLWLNDRETAVRECGHAITPEEHQAIDYAQTLHYDDFTVLLRGRGEDVVYQRRSDREVEMLECFGCGQARATSPEAFVRHCREKCGTDCGDRYQAAEECGRVLDEDDWANLPRPNLEQLRRLLQVRDHGS